jgi:dipeptidyl-peptidase 4
MKHLTTLMISLIMISFATIQAQDSTKQITLEDIWSKYTFYPKSVRGMTSLKDGKHYTMIKEGSLVVYAYKNGDSVRTLLPAEKLVPEGTDKPIRLGSYSMSKDETKFLIPTETERIYRHSSKSKYYIYDTGDDQLSLLSEEKLQLATFSPDGKEVAFVRENNLFYINLETGEEIQVTDDGKFNHIINGTCDWVYEEEFGFTKAFFWSPDSKKIAFYRFDESDVKEYTLTYYGELYPELYTYKYPKAGEDNSLVDIYVYHLSDGKSVKMDIGTETDQYIPRIKWTEDPNLLAIQRLNRLQNHLEILLASAEEGNSKVMYEEKNEYYIDITDNLIFLPDLDHYLITSEADGYNHLYLYHIRDGLVKQLTNGEWEVTNVYGYDTQKKRVYFQSVEDSPSGRVIASVDLKGKHKIISSKPGTNSARFSSNFEYYINTWSDANTPPYITVNDRNGKELRVLEDNAALKEKLSEYAYSPKEFFTISSPEFTLPDGSTVELNAWRILPVDFDPAKKYPVLLTIYGGPGSQDVRDSWGYSNTMWYQMLAQQGIMVVAVDNRGTGYRGELFKKMTYKELGKYETIDYIETAKYLGSLDYVDKDRIAIFGWSYGGFMASNAITQGADYFNTAIAVAPVTNWRYYDNIYTERFMRTPQENPDGYDKNSPINHVDKLKGNYLLVHGSTDDNVHYQNTMDMITALVNANKQFDLFIYPNKNHGIYGGNTRYHLYRKMTDFLLEHIGE